MCNNQPTWEDGPLTKEEEEEDGEEEEGDRIPEGVGHFAALEWTCQQNKAGTSATRSDALHNLLGRAGSAGGIHHT